MAPDRAVAEIERCAGTQFDPRVVSAFVEVMRERREALAPAGG